MGRGAAKILTEKGGLWAQACTQHLWGVAGESFPKNNPEKKLILAGLQQGWTGKNDKNPPRHRSRKPQLHLEGNWHLSEFLQGHFRMGNTAVTALQNSLNAFMEVPWSRSRGYDVVHL